MLIRKEFKFDAAHNLTQYHGKCERLHGHTYRLAVVIKGERNDEDMVIDFCEVSEIVKKKVIDRLDHAYINEILIQPTAENIAAWVWAQITTALVRVNCRLHAVEVWETSTSCAVFTEDDLR